MLPHLPFTLRQLQVFASLCSTRSFRRSAESLGISQASVSNQMNALEEQLGLSLFVRGRGQRPVLTAEGTAFLEDLRSFEKVAGAPPDMVEVSANKTENRTFDVIGTFIYECDQHQGMQGTVIVAAASD